MTEYAVKGLCLCAGGCAFAHLWEVTYLLAVILTIITAIEIYHIWRRCNERKRRIAALRKRLQSRKEVSNGIGVA